MNALSQRHIRTTIVALLCGSLGSGCATFSRGSLIGTEDAVVRTRAEQRIGGTHDVDIQQTESTARIVGTRYCEDITTDTIRTTSYYTAENTNINRTRMTALTAAVIVGAGILLAIYPNVEPASEDMESSLDPGTARALGGGLIGAGALVSIVPPTPSKFSSPHGARAVIVTSVIVTPSKLS